MRGLHILQSQGAVQQLHPDVARGWVRPLDSVGHSCNYIWNTVSIYSHRCLQNMAQTNKKGRLNFTYKPNETANIQKTSSCKISSVHVQQHVHVMVLIKEIYVGRSTDEGIQILAPSHKAHIQTLHNRILERVQQIVHHVAE